MISANLISVVLSLTLEMPIIALDKTCWHWMKKKLDGEQTNEKENEQEIVQEKLWLQGVRGVEVVPILNQTMIDE